jgi:MerR family transcriptional regulator, light-induced transcriptional regulator
MPLKRLVTPKDLAEAIGASESSIRRWVDSGAIRASRTAGGHRRIDQAEAVRFIRSIGATIIRPHLLGLPARDPTRGDSDEESLFQSLQAGDQSAAVATIVSWYLEGRAVAGFLDGAVARCMHRVGELWTHDERGVLVEHRATATCLAALAALRGRMPAVDEHAPLAMGAAPQGDPYQIPTMMAATVLADAGFRDVNFGANTPVELLGREAVARGASLVWLSVSTRTDPSSMRTLVTQLADLLDKHRIALVLGGRHHADCAPRTRRPNVTTLDSMSELSGFARGLLGLSRR